MPEQKISFGEMRAMGVRGLLIYCSDYHCSHWTAITGDRWADEIRLSELSFARHAAGAALMSGPTSIGKPKPGARQ